MIHFFTSNRDSGLDPASRRDIWKIVSSAVKRKNRCVLLTTHDLEEAEALCNRIGIMHQGNLKCLGSLLHLKKKFGTGYKVSISVQEQKYITDIDARPKRSALTLEERVTGFVQNLLPKAVLDYSSEPYFVFRVQQIDIKLSQLFLAMDNQSERKKFSLSREDGFVCNWSVNHASLEDLFLTVVKPKLLERSRNV
jgi:ABC-type multidrug transport system ATPase subunit